MKTESFPTLQYLLDDVRFYTDLTEQHLPDFLNKQRWFTSKGKEILQIKVEALPSTKETLGLWLATIHFADGSEELRPLAVAEVNRAIREEDLSLICATPKGFLIDATHEAGFGESLYALMAEEQELQSAQGILKGEAGKVCRENPECGAAVVPPQNSSNTVFIFPPSGFFKLFRKTEAGLHPDAELIGYLSSDCDFASVPAYGGSIAYTRMGETEPITIGLMLGRVEHNGEAWEAMLHDVAGYAKRYKENETLHDIELDERLSSPLHQEEILADLANAIGESALRRIVLLGKRTAEMHLHFFNAKAAGMQPVDLDDAYWASAKTGLIFRLNDEAGFANVQMADALKTIATWLENTSLPRVKDGCIRVHGDYHLGQVLDTDDDVIIIDFEGEPLHSLTYRRMRHPAFKDVAGMVRSLNYAPFAYALQDIDGAEWAMAAARIWYVVAARLFLTTYFDTVGNADFLPKDQGGRGQLLGFFLADKALYELAYERASRPAWIEIPRTGLLGVASMF